MGLNRAHLVIKVDDKRPVSVVVMAAQSMIAEVTIEELKRVYEQVTNMERHWNSESEVERD
jgi:hypothetical protein